MCLEIETSASGVCGWMGRSRMRLCCALLAVLRLTILPPSLTMSILTMILLLTHTAPHQTIVSATILIGFKRCVAGMTGSEAERGGFAGHCFIVHALVSIGIGISMDVTCWDVAVTDIITSGVIGSSVTTKSITISSICITITMS